MNVLKEQNVHIFVNLSMTTKMELNLFDDGGPSTKSKVTTDQAWSETGRGDKSLGNLTLLVFAC